MDRVDEHVLQAEPIGILTEVQDRVEVGLLPRPRQIADRHVLNQSAVQMAPILSGRRTLTPSNPALSPASAPRGGSVFVQSLVIFADSRNQLY